MIKFYLKNIVRIALVMALALSLPTNAMASNNEFLGSQQNSFTATGKVVDGSGVPITGATVLITGTSKGTITGIDGDFSIPNVAPADSIDVSLMGYNKVSVLAKRELSITLTEASLEIDQVVVIGYASQRKVNLTGSVASVSNKQIKDRVQTNIISAIQGTVPGVTITSRPGEAPTINFRGRGNLGTSSPLYVIDGIISDATFFSNLDPNVIESISLLKDAASAAIYGSRAAYGVVLVTTKRGKEGAFSVSYNAFVGVNQATYRPDFVDSWDYAELLNEANYNSNPTLGKNQAYSEEEIGWFRDGSKPDLYPNTQWNDLIYNESALTTRHSLNFTGGTEKINFFSGFGYSTNNDFLPNRRSQKFNLNLNLSAEITDWLTVRAGVKYIHSGKDVTSGTPGIHNTIMSPSTFVAQHSNGDWGSVTAGKEQAFNNPLRTLNNNNWSTSLNEYSMYEMGIDIKPIEGLVITGQGSYKKTEAKSKGYVALTDPVMSFLSPGKVMPGSENITNSMDMNWSSSPYFTGTGTALYQWNNDKHAITTLIGASYENYEYIKLTAKRQDFPADGFEDMGSGSTAGGEYKNDSEMTQWLMASYFGRVNYAYLDRYLFEVNVRSDGSSRFHTDNRWGVFPSVSLGWKIDQEDFMKGTKNWLTSLKLRGSVGMLGNVNNVGNYDYFPNYTSGPKYSFDEEQTSGIYESKPANVGLTWETVTLSNIGLDISLFNGKLSGTLEYYIKDTDNILLEYSSATETGISNPPSQNIGKVRNQGFEFAVTHRNNIGDFSYSVSGNLSTNLNRVMDLNGEEIIKDAHGHNVSSFIFREGYAIGSYYGLKTNGLYSQAEIDAKEYYTLNKITPNAGDIKFVTERDIEFGDDITNEDRTIIGSDTPTLSYGLNLSLQYKNFEFALFGQGVAGSSVAFDAYMVHPFFHGQDNPREYHMSRWTEANPDPNASYPRIYTASDTHTTYNRTFSDYEVFDADYFRIKSISIGYMVPREALSKIGLSSLKIFLTGENLFTIRADKKMKDFDPENRGGVIGAFGVKSLALGLNVSF